MGSDAIPARPRGRRVAAIAGVCALLALGAAAFSWEAIVLEYHLVRLRREAPYRTQLLGGPREGLAWEALERYADTPTGAGALSGMFLDDAVAQFGAYRSRNRDAFRLADLDFGTLGFAAANRSRRLWFVGQQHSGDSLYDREHPRGDAENWILVRIHGLLRRSKAVQAGACPAVERDGAVIRLFRGDRAFDLTGLGAVYGKLPSAEDPVWTVRRANLNPGEARVSPCVLPPALTALYTRSGGAEVLQAARDVLRLLNVDPDHPIPGLIECVQNARRGCTHEPGSHAWAPSRHEHAAWRVIHPAARGLSDLGPSVLPALTEALLGSWPIDSAEAVLSVYQELGEAALPYLETLLKTTRGHVWDAALLAKLAIQRRLRP